MPGLSPFGFDYFRSRLASNPGARFFPLLRNAGLWAILIVCVVEFYLHPVFDQRFTSHEVDTMLKRLENNRYDSPVAVVGDSVGKGIFRKWDDRPETFATMACNAATSSAGQYFFLQRYLRNNRPPGAVISCETVPFLGNLKNPLTENYVQRCFTNWDEILDLFLTKKDPVFSLKMIAYKLFSTFKYRLHVQKALVGFTNSDIYSGFVQGNPGINKSNFGIFNKLSRKMLQWRHESIATFYLKKMVGELQSLGIMFYYLPPPTVSGKKKVIANALRRFEDLQDQYDNIEVLGSLYRVYPENLFGDGTHLNQEGGDKFRKLIQPELDKIRKKAMAGIYLRFANSGKTVFSLTSPAQLHRLQPLNEVILSRDSKLFTLEATGGDPSLVLTDTISSLEDDVVLCIRMDAPERTAATIYFKSRETDGYSEENTMRYFVRPGYNELYFKLPGHVFHRTIRFDPGEVPGKYVIHGIEAKTFRAP